MADNSCVLASKEFLSIVNILSNFDVGLGDENNHLSVFSIHLAHTKHTAITT